jgi:hypothetical protein
MSSTKLKDVQMRNIDCSDFDAKVTNVINNGWPEIFRTRIMPMINEDLFVPLYDSGKNGGRPSDPIAQTVGLFILKALCGIDDEELIDRSRTDLRFMHALGYNLSHVPFSDKTPQRFRRRILKYQNETGTNVLADQFQSLSDELTGLMGIDKKLNRMDSLLIDSNCKQLSRLELVYEANRSVIKMIYNDYLGCDIDRIPEELRHYLEPNDCNKVIYHSEDAGSNSRLLNAIAEGIKVFDLLDTIKISSDSDNDKVAIHKQIMSEQCIINEDKTFNLIDGKKLPADGIHSPYEPEAGYRIKGNKGHLGYAVNVNEAISDNGVGIITDIHIDTNTKSDSSFLEDFIQKEPDSTGDEKTILADGSYASSKIRDEAKSKGITVVTTTFKCSMADDIYAGFEMNSEYTSCIKCPVGYQPVSCHHNSNSNICYAYFKECATCPYKDKCKPTHVKTKKSWRVQLTKSKVENAKHKKDLEPGGKYEHLKTKRNGIEGIMSVFRRKYRLDYLPVRGLQKISIFIYFSGIAYNITKMMRHVTFLKCGNFHQVRAMA